MLAKTALTVALFLSIGAATVAEQKECGQRLQVPVEITNSVGMKLRLIPDGEFMMGSAESPQELVRRYDLSKKDLKRFAREHPQHKVRITRPFYLGVTEVTQGQWKSVMGTEPWSGEKGVKVGPDYAVSYIDWEDATEFCKTLSAKERETYRLPTEAEWEYACRAGTTSLYPFGDDESQLWEYAEYYREVGERYSLRVGQKKPNPWGLKGMHGNVWEWCHDWYGGDYYDASPESDPTGPTEATTRVYRGGGWAYLSGSYRPAYRGGYPPDVRFGRLGFRVARSLSSE